MEIGIDIEENLRFKDMPDSHLKEIFSENEIKYAKKFVNAYEHFCSFWCVKEAFIKATRDKSIEFVKIETDHNPDGSPFIVLNDTIKSILKTLGFYEIKISINKKKNFSTAICLLY